MPTAPLSNEQVVHRYVEAIVAQDSSGLGLSRHPEWTADWPQSRERVRGHANERAIFDNWPGGQPNPQVDLVVGAEDRWVVTPAFTFQRIVGSGDFWWVAGTMTYPDDSTWLDVVLLELRDGKVLRETWYWAPATEAPAWRAQWVEPIG